MHTQGSGRERKRFFSYFVTGGSECRSAEYSECIIIPALRLLFCILFFFNVFFGTCKHQTLSWLGKIEKVKPAFNVLHVLIKRTLDGIFD